MKINIYSCSNYTSLYELKTTEAYSTADRSNTPGHWYDLCQTGQLLDNFNPCRIEQNSSDCRQAIQI